MRKRPQYPVQTGKSPFEADFTSDGFEWINYDSDNSVLSFIRKGKDWHDMLVFVCNFSPSLFENYRIGAPLDTTYTEIFNTDSEKYGGSNILNAKPIKAEKLPYNNKPNSVTLRVPPLSTVILRVNTRELD